jgi:hypothetical protein
MLEQLFIWGLVGVCAFLLGRRFYRLLRAALGSNQPLSCGQGCCSCSSQETCLPQSDLQKQLHRGEKS